MATIVHKTDPPANTCSGGPLGTSPGEIEHRATNKTMPPEPPSRPEPPPRNVLDCAREVTTDAGDSTAESNLPARDDLIVDRFRVEDQPLNRGHGFDEREVLGFGGTSRTHLSPGLPPVGARNVESEHSIKKGLTRFKEADPPRRATRKKLWRFNPQVEEPIKVGIVQSRPAQK